MNTYDPDELYITIQTKNSTTLNWPISGGYERIGKGETLTPNYDISRIGIGNRINYKFTGLGDRIIITLKEHDTWGSDDIIGQKSIWVPELKEGENILKFNGANGEYEVTIVKDHKKNYMTDARDGKVYKTVRINNKTWLAENIAYSTDDSKCKSTSCYTDRYYDRSSIRSVCPIDWRLPTEEDIQSLKSTMNSKEFYDYLINGGSSGLNVFLHGYYGKPINRREGSFQEAGSKGTFWYHIPNDRILYFKIVELTKHHKEERYDKVRLDKNGDFSQHQCRCVKDW